MRPILFSLAAIAAGFAATSAEAASECYRAVVEPAQYRTVTQTVVVQPERQYAEEIPAVTRLVSESVMIRPAQYVSHSVPAVYRDVARTVMTSPGRREWRVTEHYGQTIGCWVNSPATYATEMQRVIVSPERSYEDTVPAVYGTQQREVIVSPAHTIYRTAPARYAQTSHVEMVASASQHWAPVSSYCGHAGY